MTNEDTQTPEAEARARRERIATACYAAFLVGDEDVLYDEAARDAIHAADALIAALDASRS